jgi:hypothetical protein
MAYGGFLGKAQGRDRPNRRSLEVGVRALGSVTSLSMENGGQAVRWSMGDLRSATGGP